MADVKNLEADALNFAKQATDFDARNETDLAIFYYCVSCLKLFITSLQVLLTMDKYVTCMKGFWQVVNAQS
jgi:hypothetical protein